MREIKFRGIMQGEDNFDYGTFMLNHFGVHPETIGQFTGLHDKNGVEIYEGDIVKKGDSVEKVEYSKDRFRVTNFDGGKDDLYTLVNQNLVEVIGNIHQNPKLLK